MTELRSGVALTRKTDALVQNKPLAVTLHPTYLEIKRLRDRTPYVMTYDAIYRYAAELLARQVRAEKKLAKKARSNGR